MLADYPDILNVRDVCLILSIGRSLCYNLLRNGEIRSLRLGHVYKIPKKFLIEFLEKAA